MGTRETLQKPLTIFVFFGARNAKSLVHTITIQSHAVDLDWVATFRRRSWFRLNESSMTFWKVGNQPSHSPRRLPLFSSRIPPCS